MAQHKASQAVARDASQSKEYTLGVANLCLYSWLGHRRYTRIPYRRFGEWDSFQKNGVKGERKQNTTVRRAILTMFIRRTHKRD
jgi:hypothetical protein